jgi:hypothetical protein
MSAPSQLAHFFWEGALTPLQTLAFTAARDAGFEAIVWSLSGTAVPSGVSLRDAREILSPDFLDVIKHKSGPSAKRSDHYSRAVLYSDIFRIHVIKELGGWGLDADTIIIKPAEDWVPLTDGRSIVSSKCAGFTPGMVPYGVLAFPDTDVLYDYVAYISSLMELRTSAVWGGLSIYPLAKFMKERNLLDQLLPETVFYGFDQTNADLLVDPSPVSVAKAERVMQNSYSIHWWGSRYQKSVDEVGTPTVPQGSLLHNLFVKHGISA